LQVGRFGARLRGSHLLPSIHLARVLVVVPFLSGSVVVIRHDQLHPSSGAASGSSRMLPPCLPRAVLLRRSSIRILGGTTPHEASSQCPRASSYCPRGSSYCTRAVVDRRSGCRWGMGEPDRFHWAKLFWIPNDFALRSISKVSRHGVLHNAFRVRLYLLYKRLKSANCSNRLGTHRLPISLEVYALVRQSS
jgi:hypothetical protein